MSKKHTDEGRSNITDIGRRKFLQTVGITGLTIGGLGQTRKSAAQETDEETTRYNVEYNSEQGKSEAEEAAEVVYHELDPIDIITIEATPSEAQALQDNGEIEFVEEDDVSFTEEPEPPETESLADGQVTPWGIERIGAPTAHEAGVRGDGVAVAVIDSGINATHEDLEENLGEGIAYLECQGDCAEPWDDDRGHGTHVAGTVGALDNDIGVIGASPDVTLHAAKATQGGIGFNSDLAAGIVWAAFQGYEVANMSFGAPILDPIIEAAVDYAYGEGVLLVAAAMNVGGPVWYPAALSEVIAVSATDQDDSLAIFSNRGPEIDLAAPGVDILSTFPPNVDLNPTSDLYGAISGTSMAAPHVSGTGALLMGQGFTAEEARQFMEDTAEDIGLSPEEQGAGLVNAAAIVQEEKCPSDVKDTKTKDESGESNTSKKESHKIEVMH